MSRRAANYQAKREQEEEDAAASTYTPRAPRKPKVVKSSNDLIPFETGHSLPPSKVVDLFVDNFQYILASEDLHEMIQAVKSELFNRDYIAAFNNDDKRLAYVARWSPARALAYSSLFATLKPIRRLFEDPERKNRVLCVGGGAASEVVGLASVYSFYKRESGGSASSLHMDVIDIADWSTIVANLSRYILEKWLYDGSTLSTKFILGDVLSQDAKSLHLSKLDLITLLFTTNELFCEQRSETIKFLHTLSAHCQSGALLLITESAGSYSNITVGTKQFPVQFLIDTILAGKPGADNGAWEIVDQSESCWYRIGGDLQYPVKLENMRFFYRLYQKK